MVIGFDGSRAFSKDRTGTENYSFQLLKALAKVDSKNIYIIYIKPNSSVISNVNERSQNSKSKSRDSSLITRNDNIGWPDNFKFREINWPRLWTQAGLAIKTYQDKLDVLFIPAHTSPLIHKKGLKTVVTVHDLGSEYLPKMHQLKQRLYLKYITRYQLKSATKLIAVSKATKNDLIKKAGIEPGKIEIIHESYDKELFKPFDSAQGGPVKGDTLVNSLKQFDIKPGKYFLFVGTVQPRKNLERLIESYGRLLGVLPARYPAVHPRSHSLAAATRRESLLAVTPRNLVIVGSKGWLSDEIYKLPEKLGIEDNVKFLGRVEDKYLPALYSGAIALTFPSLFEGFGLPILEAQACGCPVLTSNISSMPEVAGKGALYVNPNSLNDIIRGMREVQSSKFKVQSLVKAGFENIKRFSWEKCAKETLKVLENISSR